MAVYSTYSFNAIETLSAVSGESHETTSKRIKYLNVDVLLARDLETGEYNSITLKLAAKQIMELRELVAFSACSEGDARPYFLDKLSIANTMVEHYRFGHTFQGSFGFTIESPIIRTKLAYQQQALMKEMAEPITVSPVERRVMERIVRGLMNTQEATRQQDLSVLVNGYSGGFNANMCRSIVKMAYEKKPVEYSVLWSPRIEVSLDVDKAGAVRLNETSYEYLDYAYKELKTLKPQFELVRGRVTHLIAKEAPLGNVETDRSVVIKQSNVPRGRARNVIVNLSKEDYIVANDAHMQWRTVEVTGELQRAGQEWRLSQPRDFKVVG
jgi:hypothetical protein